MATATLCQAEELLRLCARDGCAMFAMEEDLFDANAMPAKEAAQFKLSADKQPRQLDTGSHSDNEDDDLLWCPSPTFPTVRAADPPVEMRPVATKPELSSSSNSNSSMCTFEAGVIAPDVARASQPTPPIPVPQSTSMEPKQSESVHQGSLFDPQAPQQQELQCSAPPTARAGAAPVQQFDDGSGSKVIASSAPAGLSNAIPAHLQEASHLEGGGRISPDLNPAHQQQQQQQQQQHQQLQAHDLTCHTQQLQLQQPQQQQHQQAAPTGAAAAAAASSVVQHTRHTKRTPIPSVRLQRIMEGDAHASGAAGARSRPQHGAPRKRSGGSSKRGAEQDQAHGEHGAGAAQIGAHDSRRAKAARVGHHSGSSASASVSATPEPVLVPGASLSAEPSLAPSAFAWPEEGAPLLPDEAAWGGSASFGPAFARSGSSSSAAVIPSGMGSEGGLLGGEVPVFEAGMSASAPAGYGTHSLAGGVVHGGSHAMWVPTAGGPAVPASSGGGMALMGDDGLLPHDMHVTTDLLDVAAELAAAADKEGSGHGMRGSAALPTLMTAPPPQPVATYARAASTGTQRVRATGAGVPTQPRSRSRTGAAPRSKASAPPPLPRPDYDQHEDSEDGLPQVPPPRHPAGQPRGVPRAPARVLVPHPKGGCCTACKVAATPVWRTGPHGPKTLCNACGVRYTKAVTRKK